MDGVTSVTAQGPGGLELPSKQRPPQTVPGELLVRFRSKVAAEEQTKRRALVTNEGRQIPIKVEGMDATNLVPGLRLARVAPEDTTMAIEVLRAEPDVIYVEPNFVRYQFATPNDPFYSTLWGLRNEGSNFGFPGPTSGADIHAEQAWNITTGSRDVVVGVVDGGIDVNHQDLQANIWTNPMETAGNGMDDDNNGYSDDVHGFDFFHNQGSVFDPGDLNTENHATHVAGTIGAIGNNGIGVTGVNWNVSLMSLKVFGRSGEMPYPSSVLVLVRAYDYARKMRDLWATSGGTKGANIRVLNNSLGGYGRSEAEFDAVRALNDAGILFVAAAGNDTRNNDTFPVYPAGYESPNVISVAASDFKDQLTSFTNVGARTVTLSAPGKQIFSTTSNNNYDFMAGTSMASPQVAGAAALVLAAHPNLTVEKLKAALIYNGDSVPSQQFKTLTGRRLNVFSSLNAAAENDITPPAAISDFRIAAHDGRSITLAWTTPGDDGNAGLPSLYDIRYSETDLSSAQEFEAATTISPLAIPIPSVAGTPESATVEVPFRHTAGFIGLRATDNLGNTSPIAVVPVSVDATFASLYDVTESAPQPLSTGGTAVQLFGGGAPDEGYSYDYPLPFAFPFYGHWLRNVTVSLNGNLYFSPPPKFLLPPVTGGGSPLDAFGTVRALQTNMMIAGMWDDLVTTSVRAVTPDPNRVIFRWEGTTFDTHFDDGTSRGTFPVSFEIELNRDGTIRLRYGDGNKKLFPVVGISGGGPDAYVVSSHTSENSFLDLTNAGTVMFSPHFAPNPTSADLEVALLDQSVVTPVPSGGNIYSVLPVAAVPGQTIQYKVLITDRGPDAADNVVFTVQLPAGTSFLNCGETGLVCSGPAPGADGGTVTFNFGTLGQIFIKRTAEARIQIRINALAGASLVSTFTASSSTFDPGLANNTLAVTTPVADFSLFSDVIAVDGNGGNTIALRQDGTVWFWGLPFGASDSPDFAITTPRRVVGLSNVIAIATGGSHALALRSDGTVWSWGVNDLGQLGNQPISVAAFPPAQIPDLNNIQSIATAALGSFAVAADGSVWAWGNNANGQLGDGTTTNHPTPVRLTTISGVRSIATNGNCTYANTQDDMVWSWGLNQFGILGTGSGPGSSLTPVKITALSNIKLVATDGFHAVALRNDGTAWAWGSGNVGQLGNGSRNDSPVPVQVTSLSNVTTLDAGETNCLAVKSDGTVWLWGEDQLTPGQVMGLGPATGVGAWGINHAVIMADKTLQMWGTNQAGQLGDGTFTKRTTLGAVKFLQVVTPPTFKTGANVYAFPRDITIDCETYEATIHYTTNGADPSESDPALASGGTVQVDHSMVLKARAWKTGWLPSTVASASYTIVGPASPTTNIQLSSTSLSATEVGGSAQITVMRTGDTSGAASVDYRTTDTDTFTVNCAAKNGAAFARCDFATVVGTLSFAAGETSKTFNVPIINDGYAEGAETFGVLLSNVVGATLGSPSTATVTINDNETVDGANPILLGNSVGIAFFVRQHYLDFLGREPEPGEPWSNVLAGCSDQFNTNPASPAAGCDRITVSGAFFGSPEFKDKGIYVIDFYRLAFNRLPTYVEFSQDLASITGTTAPETFVKRAAFATNFVQRTEFTNIYGTMSNTVFVSTLMSGGQGQNYNLTSITTPDPANPDGNTKVTLTSTDLINRLNAATMTRAQLLRAIIQSDQITQNLETVNAFVASQYYGYLRRTPDAGGFNGWVAYLKNNPNDFRTMVNGFMNSTEYRLRFGVQ